MWHFCALVIIAFIANTAFAESNSVLGVNVIHGDKTETVSIEMSSAVKRTPKSFLISSTHKIVLDLDDTSSGLARLIALSSSLIPSVNVVGSQERVRIIVNLSRETTFNVKVSGNFIILEVDDAQPIITSTTTPEALIESIRTIVHGDANLKDAIEQINSLLLMPPNQFTEEAQEMIGQVYERLGQPEKAKAEDRAFIAMYPDSPALVRVRQRLIALEIAQPVVIANKLEPRKPRQGKDSTVDGSIAEYVYYSGTGTDGGPVNTDQIVALTNLRMSGKWQDNEKVSRVVIRNTTLTNIFRPGEDKNNLSVAYYDYENTFADYSLRVGRQMPTMGVLGRFDGIVASSSIGDDTRLKVTAGIPYVMSSQTTRQMAGVGVEKIYDSGWSTTYYFNYQTADSFPERAALGLESFYFKNGNALTMVAEYDILYKAFNSLMIHVSTEYGAYSPYALIDIRKSPVLFGERALMLGFSSPIAKAYDTVGDAVSRSNYSASGIYDFINKSTPYSNAFVVGVSKQLNPKWNLNSNVQVSNMSDSTDTSFIPSIENPQSVIQSPSTGNIYAVNFQLFGNDVRVKGNTVMIVVSLNQDQASSGKTLTLLDGETFDGYRLDSQLSFSQRIQGTISSLTSSASIKINYKIGPSAGLESQIGFSKTTVDNGFSVSDSFNQMFFIGFKYDF